MMPEGKDDYTPDQIAKRRDEVLRVMLNTPPKPHAPKLKSRGGKVKVAARPKKGE